MFTFILVGCHNIIPHATQEAIVNAQIDSTFIADSTMANMSVTTDTTIASNNIRTIVDTIEERQTLIGLSVIEPESVPIPSGIKLTTKKYDIMIRRAMQKYWKLDEQDMPWLKGLIYQESKLNPNARSYVGAKGLMQLMDYTARELGATNVSMAYDPQFAIDAGTRYLERIRKTYFRGKTNNYIDEIALTSSGYNLGGGGTRRRCSQYGYSFRAIYPYMPKETQNYWPRIKNWRSFIYYGLL